MKPEDITDGYMAYCSFMKEWNDGFNRTISRIYIRKKSTYESLIEWLRKG